MTTPPDQNVIPFKPKRHVTQTELAVERVIGEKCIPFEVKGDSMEPRLRSGDGVLIDLHDQGPPDGLFVLELNDDGESWYVARLDLLPGSDPPRVRQSYENPRYSSYEFTLGENVRIVGRVKWTLNRI